MPAESAAHCPEERGLRLCHVEAGPHPPGVSQGQKVDARAREEGRGDEQTGTAGGEVEPGRDEGCRNWETHALERKGGQL